MPRLEFTHFHSYANRYDAVTVPVLLKSGSETAEVVASIDTGSTHCVFERLHAQSLGLDVEAGEPMDLWSAAGPVKSFGHAVQITVFELVFESMVYFFADPAIQKNLLGRRGWLDRIRLGIVDHDRELYLAAYDS
jgi:hypothetical protein